MNVGEKTNEELAKNIEQFAAIKGCNCDVCLMFREAAARLRNADTFRAKLKIAINTLEKISYGDGTLSDFSGLAELTLAEIRAEGEAS